jgi:hypothetical protein
MAVLDELIFVVGIGAFIILIYFIYWLDMRILRTKKDPELEELRRNE